jgi:hypothetical protein
MKKIKRIMCTLLIGAGITVYFVYQKAKTGLTINISAGQINATLAQKFPVEKEYLLLKTTLHQPKVHLNGTPEHPLVIDMKASVTTPPPLGLKIGNKEFDFGKESKHDAMVKVAFSDIDYDPEKGTIYFKDAEILAVETDAPDAPGAFQEKALVVISFVAKQVLNRMPVYTLDESRIGPRTARLLLDEVTVSDGKIRVTLKVPE